MKKILFAIILLYGIFWLLFGINGFVHIFNTPLPEGKAGNFLAALQNSGYVMPMVYGIQILSGILLIVRRFVPAALLLLAPIIINILLFDFFLNPSALITGIILTIFYIIIFINYRNKFLSFLKP